MNLSIIKNQWRFIGKTIMKKRLQGASELIKDFGTSKSPKSNRFPRRLFFRAARLPRQSAATKTSYSSPQTDSCMPLRRDNIALARTCSRRLRHIRGAALAASPTLSTRPRVPLSMPRSDWSSFALKKIFQPQFSWKDTHLDEKYFHGTILFFSYLLETVLITSDFFYLFGCLK